MEITFAVNVTTIFRNSIKAYDIHDIKQLTFNELDDESKTSIYQWYRRRTFTNRRDMPESCRELNVESIKTFQDEQLNINFTVKFKSNEDETTITKVKNILSNPENAREREINIDGTNVVIIGEPLNV